MAFLSDFLQYGEEYIVSVRAGSVDNWTLGQHPEPKLQTLNPLIVTQTLHHTVKPLSRPLEEPLVTRNPKPQNLNLQTPMGP